MFIIENAGGWLTEIMAANRMLLILVHGRSFD